MTKIIPDLVQLQSDLGDLSQRMGQMQQRLAEMMRRHEALAERGYLDRPFVDRYIQDVQGVVSVRED